MIKKIFQSIIPIKQRINLRYFSYKIRAIKYYGNRYTCNCCGKSFRKFLDYGNIKRQNAACPFCDSLERNRVLWFYLKNELKIETEKIKLLHFAPERILKKNIKKLKNIDYINGDIDPSMADTVIDITNTKLPDNSFDLIICAHVLGHVLNEKKGVDEMFRILQPNGIALILTVVDKNNEETFENSEIITENDKLTFYGEKNLLRKHGLDFGKRLSISGFNVEEINYAEILGKDIHEKFCLGNGERETIYKCTKQN